ncbi:MAG: hypothetical protein AAB443_04255 [Patescibacteria group bacterium]
MLVNNVSTDSLGSVLKRVVFVVRLNKKKEMNMLDSDHVFVHWKRQDEREGYLAGKLQVCYPPEYRFSDVTLEDELSANGIKIPGNFSDARVFVLEACQRLANKKKLPVRLQIVYKGTEFKTSEEECYEFEPKALFLIGGLMTFLKKVGSQLSQ